MNINKKLTCRPGGLLFLLMLCFSVNSWGSSMGLFSGKRPMDLGYHNGYFKPASNKPNSVNSQAAPGHPAAILPLKVTGDPGAFFAQLARVVAAQKGAKIIEQTSRYLYAEFTTPLMGFVDDVEFALDADRGLVHVRSASRLGYSDLGTNRKRIETLRQLANQAAGS